jgi:hypothetical protein
MTGAVQRLQKIEAEWMAKSTQAAIDAAKQVISENDINGRAMIGSLNDLEWGWIAMAAVFAWIKTKSQQAVAEGIGYDEAIRTMPGSYPQPWEFGAVESVLPALADVAGLPWDKPVGEWSKNQMASMMWHSYRLVDQALAARDEGAACKITMNSSQAKAERELSAKNGGALLARGELNDQDIPF